jgi:hypothetical protein
MDQQTDEQEPSGTEAGQVNWNSVSNPITPDEEIPAERKVVLVWLAESALPYCGYIRYAAGDIDCPYFVVYHGNSERGSNVIAWCDCLPGKGPDHPNAKTYTRDQKSGRGYPARRSGENINGNSIEARIEAQGE